MLLQGNYAHTPSLARGHRNHSADGRPTHLTHCSVLGRAEPMGGGSTELGNAHTAQHSDPFPSPLLCSAQFDREPRFFTWHWRREAGLNAACEERKPRQGAAGLNREDLCCAEGGGCVWGKRPSCSRCQSVILREEAGTLASVAGRPMPGQMSWREKPCREASEHH